MVENGKKTSVNLKIDEAPSLNTAKSLVSSRGTAPVNTNASTASVNKTANSPVSISSAANTIAQPASTQPKGTAVKTSSSYPSHAEVMTSVYNLDKSGAKKQAQSTWDMYKTRMKDSSSVYYQPYSTAQNSTPLTAISKLTGTDYTGGITQDEINQLWLQADTSNVGINGTYSSSKSNTPAQQLAYYLNVLETDEKTTQAAESEMSSMMDEVSYLVSRGYSDDYIRSHVSFDNYSTLSKALAAQSVPGTVLPNFNRAINLYGEDTINGMIYAAHNKTSYTGLDNIMGYYGEGSGYTPNIYNEEMRDCTSKLYYPTNFGASDTTQMHSFCQTYGISRFDRQWVEDNSGLLLSNKAKNDSSGKSDWEFANEAVDNYEAAQSELEKLKAVCLQKMESGAAYTDVCDYIEKEIANGKTYPTLSKMETARRNGSSIPLSDSVEFALPYFTGKASYFNSNATQEYYSMFDVNSNSARDDEDTYFWLANEYEKVALQREEEKRQAALDTFGGNENVMNTVFMTYCKENDLLETDENGNYVMQDKTVTITDDDGNPVLDENGEPVTKEVSTYTLKDGADSVDYDALVAYAKEKGLTISAATDEDGNTVIPDSELNKIIAYDQSVDTSLQAKREQAMIEEAKKIDANPNFTMASWNAMGNAGGKEWLDANASMREGLSNYLNGYGCNDANAKALLEQNPYLFGGRNTFEYGSKEIQIDERIKQYGESVGRALNHADDAWSNGIITFDEYIDFALSVAYWDEQAKSAGMKGLKDAMTNGADLSSEVTAAIETLEENIGANTQAAAEQKFEESKTKAVEAYGIMADPKSALSSGGASNIYTIVNSTDISNVSDEGYRSAITDVSTYMDDYFKDYVDDTYSRIDAIIPVEYKGGTGIYGENGVLNLKYASVAAAQEQVMLFMKVAKYSGLSFDDVLKANGFESTEQLIKEIGQSVIGEYTQSYNTVLGVVNKGVSLYKESGTASGIDFTDEQQRSEYFAKLVEDGTLTQAAVDEFENYISLGSDYADKNVLGMLDKAYNEGKVSRESKDAFTRLFTGTAETYAKNSVADYEKGANTSGVVAKGTDNSLGMWATATVRGVAYGGLIHANSWMDVAWAYTRHAKDEMELIYRNNFSRDEMRSMLREHAETIPNDAMRAELLYQLDNYEGDIYNFSYDYTTSGIQTARRNLQEHTEAFHNASADMLTADQLSYHDNIGTAVNSALLSTETLLLTTLLAGTGLGQAAAMLTANMLTTAQVEGAQIFNTQLDNGASRGTALLTGAAGGAFIGLVECASETILAGASRYAGGLNISANMDKYVRSAAQTTGRYTASLASKLGMKPGTAAAVGALGSAVTNFTLKGLEEAFSEPLQEAVQNVASQVMSKAGRDLNGEKLIDWSEVEDEYTATLVNTPYNMIFGGVSQSVLNDIVTYTTNTQNYRSANEQIGKLSESAANFAEQAKKAEASGDTATAATLNAQAEEATAKVAELTKAAEDAKSAAKLAMTPALVRLVKGNRESTKIGAQLMGMWEQAESAANELEIIDVYELLNQNEIELKAQEQATNEYADALKTSGELAAAINDENEAEIAVEQAQNAYDSAEKTYEDINAQFVSEQEAFTNSDENELADKKNVTSFTELSKANSDALTAKQNAEANLESARGRLETAKQTTLGIRRVLYDDAMSTVDGKAAAIRAEEAQKIAAQRAANREKLYAAAQANEDSMLESLSSEYGEIWADKASFMSGVFKDGILSKYADAVVQARESLGNMVSKVFPGYNVTYEDLGDNIGGTFDGHTIRLNSKATIQEQWGWIAAHEILHLVKSVSDGVSKAGNSLSSIDALMNAVKDALESTSYNPVGDTKKSGESKPKNWFEYVKQKVEQTEEYKAYTSEDKRTEEVIAEGLAKIFSGEIMGDAPKLFAKLMTQTAKLGTSYNIYKFLKAQAAYIKQTNGKTGIFRTILDKQQKQYVNVINLFADAIKDAVDANNRLYEEKHGTTNEGTVSNGKEPVKPIKTKPEADAVATETTEATSATETTDSDTADTGSNIKNGKEPVKPITTKPEMITAADSETAQTTAEADNSLSVTEEEMLGESPAEADTEIMSAEEEDKATPEERVLADTPVVGLGEAVARELDRKDGTLETVEGVKERTSTRLTQKGYDASEVHTLVSKDENGNTKCTFVDKNDKIIGTAVIDGAGRIRLSVKESGIKWGDHGTDVVKQLYRLYERSHNSAVMSRKSNAAEITENSPVNSEVSEGTLDTDNVSADVGNASESPVGQANSEENEAVADIPLWEDTTSSYEGETIEYPTWGDSFDEAMNAEETAEEEPAPAVHLEGDTAQRTAQLLGVKPDIKKLNVDDIKVDAKTYQFKSNSDENGVTDTDRITGAYQPGLIGTLTVYEDENGDYYIINGHHRLALLKENNETTVPAVVIKASDGVTKETARTFAALQNIAEGKGTAVDAAKVLRETGITDASQLSTYGLSPTKGMVDSASKYVNLSDLYFNALVDGTITEDEAYVMGKYFAGDEARQEAFNKYVRENKAQNFTKAQLEILGQELLRSNGSEAETYQASLFDMEGIAPVVYNLNERIKLIDAMKKLSKQTKSILKRTNNSASQLGLWGNTIDVDSNQSGVNEYLTVETMIDNRNVNGVDEIVGEFAQQIADGTMTIKAASEEAVKRVVDMMNDAGKEKTSAKVDKEYLKAVESGDTETAQRIVNDEAEKWADGKGITINMTPDATYTPIANEETGEIIGAKSDYKSDYWDYAEPDTTGSRTDAVLDGTGLVPLYRSYDNGRTVYDGHPNGWSKKSTGVFLTSNPYVASAFDSYSKHKAKITKVFAKADNPLIVDAQGNNYAEIPTNGLGFLNDQNSDIAADNLGMIAFANGYDAVIIQNVKEGVGGDVGTDVILKNANQLKSADPITYDDNGNIIPPSERFNDAKNDLRYSAFWRKGVYTNQTLAEALEYAVRDAIRKGDKDTAKSIVKNIMDVFKNRTPLEGSEKIVSPLNVIKALAEDLDTHIYEGVRTGERIQVPYASLWDRETGEEHPIMMNARIQSQFDTWSNAITTNAVSGRNFASVMSGIAETLLKHLTNTLDSTTTNLTSDSSIQAFAGWFFDYMTTTDMQLGSAMTAYTQAMVKLIEESGDEGLQKMWEKVQYRRKQLTDYINASNAQRLGAYVVSKGNKSGDRQTWKKKLDSLISYTVDRTHIAELVDEKVGGHKLQQAALYNPYDKRKGDRVLKGRRFVDPNGKDTGFDTFEVAMEKSGIQPGTEAYNELNKYLIAKVAQDRAAQGMPAFDSAADYQAMGWSAAPTSEELKQYTDRVEMTRSDIVKAAEGFWKFNRNFVQTYLVNEGLLDAQTWTDWQNKTPHYASLKRYLSHIESNASSVKNTALGAEFKRYRGNSNLQIINPIESMVDMVHAVASAVADNKLKRVFSDMYESNEGLGLIAERVDGDKVNLHDDDVIAVHYYNPVRNDTTESLEGAETITLDNDTEASGIETRYYKINDRELYNLLADVPIGKAAECWNTVGRATKMMTMLTTGANALFAVKNMVRDMQHSINYGTWAGNYFSGIYKWAKAADDIRKELFHGTGSQQAKDYIDLGGGEWERLSTDTKQSVKSMRRDLFGRTKTESIGHKIYETATLANFNTLIETASRYAEYKYGKNDTSANASLESKQAAFMSAMEATVDFQRAGNGAWTGILRKCVPFLNASLQGNYQDIRVIKNAFSDNAEDSAKARKALAKSFFNQMLTGAIVAVFNLTFGSDEDKDEYMNVDEGIKETYALIPLRNLLNSAFGTDVANKVFGGRDCLRIPVSSSGIEKIFYNFGRKVVEDTVYDGKSATGIAADVVSTAANIIWGNWTDYTTVWSPISDVKSNTAWYGDDLISSYVKSDNPKDSSKWASASSTGLSQSIARLIHSFTGDSNFASPIAIDYLLQQYTGIIGQLAIPLLSTNKYTGESLTNPDKVTGIGIVDSVISALLNVANTALKSYTIDTDSSSQIADRFDWFSDTLTQIVTEGKNGTSISTWVKPNLTDEEYSQMYEDAVNLTASKGVIDTIEKSISAEWSKWNAIMKGEEYTYTDEQGNETKVDYGAYSLKDREILAEQCSLNMRKEYSKITPYITEFTDKYVTDSQVMETMNALGEFAGVNEYPDKINTPSSFEIKVHNLGGSYTTDLENGERYMTYSQGKYNSTNSVTVLPSPVYEWSEKKVDYEIPEEYKATYDADFEKAYKELAADFFDELDAGTYANSDNELAAWKKVRTNANKYAREQYLLTIN